MRRPLPFTPAAAAAVLTFTLVSCSRSSSREARPQAAIVATATGAMETRTDGRAFDKVSSLAASGAPANEAAPVPAAPPAADAQQSALPTVSDPTSMIIRNGTAAVEVDTLANAIRRVRELATRVGGFVANSAIQTGADQRRAATLEVRLPAARFDDAIGGLSPLGTVQSVNVSAQDVGEEYVDVGARVANARRLETRLIALLEARTGKLSDVLSVERELARVREEIERYEGRLRYLRARTAMSTLSISLIESAPIVATPGEHPLTDAVERSWRNFLGFIAMAIASLGWLIPLAVIVVIVVPIARRMRPRRTPTTTPPAEGPKEIERAA